MIRAPWHPVRSASQKTGRMHRHWVHNWWYVFFSAVATSDLQSCQLHSKCSRQTYQFSYCSNLSQSFSCVSSQQKQERTKCQISCFWSKTDSVLTPLLDSCRMKPLILNSFSTCQRERHIMIVVMSSAYHYLRPEWARGEFSFAFHFSHGCRLHLRLAIVAAQPAQQRSSLLSSPRLKPGIAMQWATALSRIAVRLLASELMKVIAAQSHLLLFMFQVQLQGNRRFQGNLYSWIYRLKLQRSAMQSWVELGTTTRLHGN